MATSQLPNLLDGYSTRPSWNVAGVDYAVGATSTSLKDPATISMAGVSIDTSSRTITISGNNITLDGYDFSLHGGYQVTVAGSNATISNSNFAIGANQGSYLVYGTSGASNLTLAHNTFDGSAIGNATSFIGFAGSGQVKMEYNWFKEFPQHVVEFTQANGSPSFSVVYKYNLVEQGAIQDGAHLNFLQFGGGTASSVDVEFNTTYQTPQASGGEGFQFYSNTQGGVIQNATMAYNTMIAAGGDAGSAMSYMVHANSYNDDSSAHSGSVHDNFFDLQAAWGAFYSAPSGWSFSNNMDMRTGQVVNSNNTESVPKSAPVVVPAGADGSSGSTSSGSGSTGSTLPAAPVIASFSTDSGAAGDKITNDNTVELKGSAAAGSTVKVYDGTTQIGSATADSSGAWDYITKVLTDAKHTLTATATNSSGQTSAASSALAITVDTKAPTAPTMASHTVNSANQVVLSGSAEASSVVKVFDGTTQIGTVTADSNGAWGYTSAALAAGSHSLTAKATDAAGNTGAASTAFAASISSSAPTSPTSPSSPTAPTSPTAGTVVESAGSTTLVESSGKFYLNGSTGSGPTLKDNGVAFVSGSDGTWTPIGAEKTATGYEVAWKETSTGQYTAWNTDNNGNYVSHVDTLTGSTWGGSVSGTDSGLKSLETTFHQDLNGDGQIGTSTATAPTSPAPTTGTVVESAGVTSLVESGGKFYLNGSSGTGPSLKDGGADFVSGSDGTWTPIGAEKTATGYQVAWKEASTGEYTAWNTDNNGNYVSHVSTLTGSTSGGSVSGTDSGLKSLETSFHQDLNGDGQVGTSNLATSSTSTTQTIATSSSTTSNTQTSTSGNDVFVGTSKADTFSFAANFGNDVVKGFVASGPAHDAIEFSKSVFDSFASVLSHATQSGGDVVIATGDDTLTLKNMKVGSLTSQDFHFA
ncbi:Ig-like domain-containing protein [Bradyrhizobium sp. CSS354]|uniref:Ig-like domain-containing protein n=1 Tax=Bradyrhizobium sp. CSS354 TaxID=2699172 RepID=UPI0023B12AD7|nr:Ig-like domain-containing protein [Bradyrhizobium sp. CSS354]